MNSSKKQNYNFAFFGTDDFSLKVLEKLIEAGFIPSLIVTAPDRPAGRGQKMQEPIIKTWIKNSAEFSEIEIVQPEKLDDEFVSKLRERDWDFFVTASYGKIISKEVLDIAERGAFNVHPSLLPLYRGASPIESAILDDQKETGVTIMLMDEKMDHGPILNQEFVYFETWPAKIEVENKLAEIGGQLLAETIEPFLNGEVEEQEQDHEMATFTKKITKGMGEISLADLEESLSEKANQSKAREIFLKVQALNPWPGVFFFIKKDGREIRVKIKSAEWITQPDKSEEEFGNLKIKTVLPEGKQEMSFEDFRRGYLK
jgi:methionyl-tRNA formyltransferase